jgi:hypothetical protein
MNHPIRKRAWHRALKRGDLWIIVSPSNQNAAAGGKFARVIISMYCQINTAYITWPFEEYTYTPLDYKL